MTLNRVHSIFWLSLSWVNHALPFSGEFPVVKFESLHIFVSWFYQVFRRLWICLYFSMCLVYIYYIWKISLLLIRLSLTIYIHPCHKILRKLMFEVFFAFETLKIWIRTKNSLSKTFLTTHFPQSGFIHTIRNGELRKDWVIH